MADGPTAAAGSADSRVMDFGSVNLDSQVKDGEVALPARLAEGTQPPGFNVAEMVVSCGFGTVIRHRDLEGRSNYYDALLAAESAAISKKRGLHSAKDPPVMHVTDLLTVSKSTTKTSFFVNMVSVQQLINILLIISPLSFS